MPSVTLSASDAHYLAMGRITTVVGIGISVATAYVAMRFNNIMDMLQLVFSFVNAPLFATFLLGMFWRRSTGEGAFAGLVSGLVYGLTPKPPEAHLAWHHRPRVLAVSVLVLTLDLNLVVPDLSQFPP